MNICLILSGGKSERFKGSTPKQYNLLGDKEIIAYSIETMKQSNNVDKVIVMASEEYCDILKKQYDVEVVLGGSTRNASLKKGLEYIKQKYPECEKILINEAARPFITKELIEDYFNKLDDYDGVITTQHITDSLGKYDEHTTDRSEYYLIQAPEAFSFSVLYENFDAESSLTATSQQLPQDSKVYCNFDFKNNLKITYQEDMIIAEALKRSLN